MIKVTDKILEGFLDFCSQLGEYPFGSKAYLKNQLQSALNNQGYWAGVVYRIYYVNSEFTAERRF